MRKATIFGRNDLKGQIFKTAITQWQESRPIQSLGISDLSLNLNLRGQISKTGITQSFLS